MTISAATLSPHTESVDIGCGRTVTVRAHVDPVMQHPDVSLEVELNGRTVGINVDWNELFNLSGPFLYQRDDVSLLLTEDALYDLECATWRILSIQGHVPTEWQD